MSTFKKLNVWWNKMKDTKIKFANLVFLSFILTVFPFMFQSLFLNNFKWIIFVLVYAANLFTIYSIAEKKEKEVRLK